MAEQKRSPVLVILAVLGGLTVVGCCGGGLAVVMAPQILVNRTLSDAPLDLPAVTPDPVMCGAKDLELESTGRTTMTGPEATVCLYPQDAQQLEGFRLSATGSEARVEASIEDAESGKYLNFSVAGEMTLEEGWFSHVTVSEMSVGKWDLSGFMAGEDLTAQANESLTNSRMDNPELAEMLDGFQRMTVEDGRFVFESAAPTP